MTHAEEHPMLRTILSAVLAVLMLLGQGPAFAAIPERYLGTVAIGDQPAFPVHAELNRSGTQVTGAFTIPGGVYRIEGQAADEDIKGRFTGDGVEGDFTLRVRGDAAEGRFVLGGQAGVLSMRRTQAGAQEALGPPPQTTELTQAQRLQDLDALVRILTTEHGAPFHRVSRGAFEAEAARVRAQLPGLPGPRMAAAFRRLSMMIGDGHTGVSLFRAQPRYPLATFWFANGVRVVETRPEHARLLGARVTAVDGVPMRAVQARLRHYSPLGETAWSYRADLPALLNRPELLESAGVSERGHSVWTFRRVDGEVERVTLTPVDFPAAGRVQLGGQPPLWAQRPDEQFRREYRPDGRTLYVNFRGYDDLAANAAALGRELDERRPRRLIIDMRANGGGDYTKGRELLLPVILQRPWINRRDALFVLVGRNTFSAAMANAADFKSMTNATLVGEPVGEKPNSWQEPRRFHLPNSGLPVNVSTRYYRFAADGVDAIKPHIHAEPRWRDWAQGRDTAIDAIMK